MSGGDLVSFLNNYNGKEQFCCGLITAENGTAGCANNRGSFTLGSARLMYGYAALENATVTSDEFSSSSTSTTSEATAFSTAGATSGTSTDGSCRDDSTAIGAGVGVPLGVMALAGLAWGFWERRKRVGSQKAAAGAGGPNDDSHHHASRSYYDKWQVPGGGGHLQPPQQLAAGLKVAELHSRHSPAEMAENN